MISVSNSILCYSDFNLPVRVVYALNRNEVKPLQANLAHFDLNKNVQQWFYVAKK